MPEHACPDQIEPVAIEKLVYGGEGLGRLESGEVIFVPWSVPGDQLNIQRQAGKQKPARGTLQEIRQASAERIQAPCSVFGACGGCQWQQVSYAAQRHWKQKIVVESLERIGKLRDIQVLETLGDDSTQWHYRNRVQWEIQWQEAHQRYALGYLKAESHELVAFETCWIISPELNLLADWLQAYFAQNADVASQIKRLEVMQNAEGQILLGLEGHMQEALTQALAQAFPSIIGIVAFQSLQKAEKPKTLFGQNFIQETIFEKQYRVSAGSFFQVNRAATERLLDTLSQWLPPKTESLLDLYTGVGLFALHFQDRVKRIVAIEGAASSIADAQRNAEAHGVSQIDWRAGDVGKILASLTEHFETAIVDPPRAGCQPAVLNWLNQHVTGQIFYVSCNPTTLARDLKTLIASGWAVQAVQPVDMFPQTYHVETLVHLQRH